MKRMDLRRKEDWLLFYSWVEDTRMSDDAEKDNVAAILQDVRCRGNAALVEYTLRWDKADISAGIEVPQKEMSDALERMSPEWVDTLKQSMANIQAHHEMQKLSSFMAVDDGRMVGRKITPMSRVGVYAPGGRAFYPSSVLMDVIPAKVAGVKEIILCTPPNSDGRVPDATLAAACMVGVDRVFRVGGAQAVAAMAYGTASIPQVDKIVGPGNIFVAMAKRELFGRVGIDSIAGPSDILVVADDTARLRWVAADLLSQAEHDPMAQPVLVTTSETLYNAIEQEINLQLSVLPKVDTALASVNNRGLAVLVNDLYEALEVANYVAPEHLELCVDEPMNWLGRVQSAGAVFLGHYTPEPVGDYWAGPNHVLPTGGTARFFSALGVEDFVKRISVVYYSEDDLRNAAGDIARFARSEELEAHARAVEVRQE